MVILLKTRSLRAESKSRYGWLVGVSHQWKPLSPRNRRPLDVSYELTSPTLYMYTHQLSLSLLLSPFPFLSLLSLSLFLYAQHMCIHMRTCTCSMHITLPCGHILVYIQSMCLGSNTMHFVALQIFDHTHTHTHTQLCTYYYTNVYIHFVMCSL